MVRKTILTILFITITSFTSPIAYTPSNYEAKYYNIAQKINCETGILVLAYNRPDYFRRCITSLEKNPESQTLPFFIVLDGGPKSAQKEHIEIIKNSTIRHKHIILHPTNFGCARSNIDARRFMFEWCNFERIIFFQDDLVIAPEYINFVLNLEKWASNNFDNIGSVTAFSRCFLTRKEKGQRLTEVGETYEFDWGYCMNKKTYNAIKDFMNELEEKFFINFPPNKPNGQAIADWLKEKLISTPTHHHKRTLQPHIDYPSVFQLQIERAPSFEPYRDGQDIEMRLALFKAGYIKLATQVNRALYIGKNGVHHNKHYWKFKGFENIQLDRFPQDRNIHEFTIGSTMDNCPFNLCDYP